MKSTIIQTLILLCLTGAFNLLAKRERPNIIFIFTDDHGSQALSAYNDTRMQTPAIDRLADEGIRFDRCYVTNSICNPSRAVILTGKYSHLNGNLTNAHVFNGAQQTFPKLLQKEGYETAIIGKWHLRSTPTGFDHYDILDGQGPYYNPPMITRGDDGQPTKIPHTGYTTDIIGEKTIEWIKSERDPSKPFMLMTQHKAPHGQWLPSLKYVNWLDDVEIWEPPTLFDDFSGRTQASAANDMSIARTFTDRHLKFGHRENMNDEQWRVFEAAYRDENADFFRSMADMSYEEIVRWRYQRYVKDYLRCVRSVDDNVKALLDYLDESGLADNTVVIYSSDQGWYLGEHGMYDKRWMYEESLVTPLLIRWPGVVAPGSVNGDIVSNLDFAQTFLDIAGASQPDDMQGGSLVPLLHGKTPKNWRTHFYYHYYENPGSHNVARHYGVTNGRYKLIHFYQLEGRPIDDWELYDLVNDPDEMESVYGNIEYMDIQDGLKKQLMQLRKKYKVPEVDTFVPGRR